MSVLGAWDTHYAGLTSPRPYGGETTYRMAAEWVQGCVTVEDWGCGTGWLRQFVPEGRYLGIDGSQSPFADVVADLATRQTRAEGIVLRHVLEHNHNWRLILANAIASFTRRLFVAVFTPSAEITHVMFTEPEYGDVPVISFATDDLRAALPEWHMDVTVRSATFYGSETVLAARRD